MASLPFPLLTAAEAAQLISDGDRVAFSGFTAAGSAKEVPAALAARARAEHAAGRPFRIGVVSGGSTGRSVDGALAEAEAIAFRTPYQSDPTLRRQINAGQVRFVDLHLSALPQMLRAGLLGPLDWAVVEASELDAAGNVVLSTSVGASNTFLRLARRVIIELNAAHAGALRGLHDIYEPDDPPRRRPIPIERVADRIGSPLCAVDPARIAAVVLSDREDETREFEPPSAVTDRIGQHIAEFLVAEVRAGRLPAGFPPLQSGVGNVANAALAALGAHPGVPPFEMYTEVLQDSVVPLLEQGRCLRASTCALALGPAMMRRVLDRPAWLRERVVLRPQEITNHPEVVRRLGLVSLNTALEVDLGGNVNSTHLFGKTLMNGIGGSGDFTRNAWLSIFSCPSTAKDGRISAVVPLAAHMDHNEHSVQVVVTEQGVADLRGRDPAERAALIIERCAHPDYRPELREYLRLVTAGGHEPLSLSLGLAMHRQYLRHGDMRGIDWEEFRDAGHAGRQA